MTLMKCSFKLYEDTFNIIFHAFKLCEAAFNIISVKFRVVFRMKSFAEGKKGFSGESKSFHESVSKTAERSNVSIFFRSFTIIAFTARIGMCHNAATRRI